MSTPVLVSDVVDRAGLSRFQIRVITMCLLLGLSEGLNALSVGYALPSLADSYGTTAAALGIVFVAALAGEGLAYFFLAPLADRFGRRTLVRIGVLLFGLTAIPSAMVSSVEALTFWRFLAGVGIGCAVTNGFALAAEYSPTRTKGRVLAAMGTGATAGGVAAGLLATLIIPAYGGSALLLVGGLIPLALLLVSIPVLPESVEYLADRGRTEEVRALLRRIDPDHAAGEDVSYQPTRRTPGVGIVALFRDGRSGRTALLWAITLLLLFNGYVIFSYLTTLLLNGGVAERSAILSATLATFGGMVSALLLGIVLDRTRIGVAAGAAGLLMGIVALLLLAHDLASGTPNDALAVLLGAVLGFGALFPAGAPNVIAVQIYPAALRATGIATAQGMGRVGGLLAPIVVAALLSAQVSPSDLFRLMCIPLVVVGVLLVLYRVVYGNVTGQGVTTAALVADVQGETPPELVAEQAAEPLTAPAADEETNARRPG